MKLCETCTYWNTFSLPTNVDTATEAIGYCSRKITIPSAVVKTLEGNEAIPLQTVLLVTGPQYGCPNHTRYGTDRIPE